MATSVSLVTVLDGNTVTVTPPRPANIYTEPVAGLNYTLCVGGQDLDDPLGARNSEGHRKLPAWVQASVDLVLIQTDDPATFPIKNGDRVGLSSATAGTETKKKKALVDTSIPQITIAQLRTMGLID